MCLIIHKPPVKGINIPVELLNDAYCFNSDGWGIMWVSPVDNSVRVHKGFDLNRLILDVEEIQRNHPESDIFVHLRMATHGAVDMYNCHPFLLGNSGVYMMHNGVIDIAQDTIKSSKSDTRLFGEMITPMLENNSDLIFDKGFQNLVLSFIGCSRLVFMNSEGKYSIVTDTPWTYWRGLSLSNTYAWTLWKQSSKSSKKKNKKKSKTRVDKLWNQATDPYYNRYGRREYESEDVDGDEDDNLNLNLYTTDYAASTTYKLNDLLHLDYSQLEYIAERNIYDLLDAIYDAGQYGVKTDDKLMLET